MKGFLSGFSRALGVFGMLLLGIVLVFDHRWAGAWVGVILVFSATVLLRTYQVPLTKYGALNFLALARKFIQLSALDFFRRIHRRRLLDFTGQ